ncbi:MAG: iron ABC transporter permease [Pseudomonadales bacterium]|jgi:iron(III) transport system permease protein|nr:iron ABC transporter permease [Pseudomonadales bacterium]
MANALTITGTKGFRFGLGFPQNSWTLASLCVAALVALPVAAVIWVALKPSGDIWSHLIATSLPGYIGTTLWLMLGVGTSVLLTGVTAAWLVTMCRFPGRRVFEWLLLLPLAFPAYVIAYAYTDLLEYSGAVQVFLRMMFEWQTPQDYWFPEVRSLGGAVTLMGVVLYPYVYLLARAAFFEQSVNVLEVTRVLGHGPWRAFFRVSLPAARPAIAIGVALALMETLNDFGTVDFFAVQTMTTALFDVWQGMGSLAGGAQIAATMLAFVVLLISIERFSRRQQKVYQNVSSRFRELPSYRLKGLSSLLAFTACLLPILIGFVIPLIVLIRLAVIYFHESWTADFRSYALNSLVLSATAAGIALLVALLIAYSQRLAGGRVIGIAARIASLGYAVPGAVLGVGVLIPFAYFDNSLDALMREMFGISTGLLLSGTLAAVIFAYVVRFLAVALGQVESSLAKVSPSLDMAARTLGYRASETLLRYHVPLIRGGMLTAVIIVFVDCMKELPATLILRPFNFETLATHVYWFASDEMLGEAALGSLAIVLVGLLPVVLLSTMTARARSIRLSSGSLT